MEKLLHPEEVAQFLKVDVQTISRLREDGELPGIKVRSQWRYEPSRVQAYVDRNRTPEKVA